MESRQVLDQKGEKGYAVAEQMSYLRGIADLTVMCLRVLQRHGNKNVLMHELVWLQTRIYGANNLQYNKTRATSTC